jgi:hypothetical protein
MAFHAERTAQQGASGSELAVRQRLADATGADAHVAVELRLDGIGAEAAERTDGAQHVQIATSLVAKAETGADPDFARSQACDQHAAHEILGGRVRQARTETQQPYPVGQRAEQAHALARRGQPRHGGMALEVLARQWLEAEHHQRQLARVRTPTRMRQQGLVATMHAVEGADAHDAAMRREAGPVRVPEDPLHEHCSIATRPRRPRIGQSADGWTMVAGSRRCRGRRPAASNAAA